MLKSDVFFETVAGVTTQASACCGAMGTLLIRGAIRLAGGFPVLDLADKRLTVWVHYCPACGKRQ